MPREDTRPRKQDFLQGEASLPDSKRIKMAIPRVQPSTGHHRASDPEASRARSLDAWLQILKIDLQQSSMGRQVLRILSSGLTPDEEEKEVSDTLCFSLRSKSANTISQRASQLSQYLNWATKNVHRRFR